MAASNEALRYVSYPTQVLGKSCKMVPVMIGGLVLGGRTFTTSQYAQVIFVTLGVAIFNFGADAKKTSGSDSAYGLSLIALSLVMDAVTGGLQDRVKRTTKALNPRAGANVKPSVYESMLYTNLSGFVVALGFAYATGQLESGVRSCFAHVTLARAVFVYSLASAVGQVFIYYTITHFDVLVLTTVTTTRKIFSTVISVFRDPSNALNRTQWLGCSLVFTFLTMDVVSAVFRTHRFIPPPAQAERRAPSSDRVRRDPNAGRAVASTNAQTTSFRRRSSRKVSS
jgi:UDP-galactose transporter B1